MLQLNIYSSERTRLRDIGCCTCNTAKSISVYLQVLMQCSFHCRLPVTALTQPLDSVGHHGAGTCFMSKLASHVVWLPSLHLQQRFKYTAQMCRAWESLKRGHVAGLIAGALASWVHKTVHAG